MASEDTVTRIDELIEKGNNVLSTHKPNAPNVIGFPTLDTGTFTEWKAQVIAFLTDFLGDKHVYVKSFGDQVTKGFKSHVEAGLGILRAVREDVTKGYL